MIYFKAGQARQMARRRLQGKWQKAAVPFLIYGFLYLLPTLIVSLISNPYITSQDSSAAGVERLVSVYQLLVAGAFALGVSVLSLKILREESFDASTVFSGFSRYGTALCTGILIGIFSTLWACLFLLPGMMLIGGAGVLSAGAAAASVPSLAAGVFFLSAGAVLLFWFLMRYQMTYFIIADNPGIRASQAIAISVRMMAGPGKTHLLILMLSFIGWLMLSFIPLYGAIWFLLAGNFSFLSVFAAALLIAVFLAAFAFVTLYMNTAQAVFYSGLTGNFRQADPDPAAESGISAAAPDGSASSGGAWADADRENPLLSPQEDRDLAELKKQEENDSMKWDI